MNPPSATAALRRVVAAEGVSNFGSMLSRLALPWLAALGLQASPADMAGLLVADVAAAAVGALLLGPWVDRQGKRRVMLLADAGRLLLLGLAAWATWRGWASMPLLMAVAAGQGLLTLAFELARSAWIAQHLAAPALPGANAQLAAVGSLSETAAFALGGWLYQGLGAAWALLLDAATYALSAACLRGLPADGPAAGPPAADAPAPQSATEPGWWTQTADGWREIVHRPDLRALAAIEAALALAMALAGTSYMIFVSRDLGLATGPLGLVFALGGLGAVLGAALAPWLGRRLGPGRAMVVGLAAGAVGAACVPLAQGAAGLGALAWLAAQQVLGDAGQTVHAVHDRSWRQRAVSPARLARIDAGLRSVGQAATLAGAWLGATLGAHWSTAELLWLAAACTALAALVAAAGLGPGAGFEPGAGHNGPQ